MYVFLRMYLLNWLEVMSLLGGILESIVMIDDLMSIIEVSCISFEYFNMNLT